MTLEIKGHGSRQLEIKSRFPLEERRNSRFTMDIWCFIPATLDISEKGFGRNRFFEVTRSLTRLSSSRIPLSEIISPECSRSPLNRIRASLGQDRDRILYELRALAAMYAAESREAEKELIQDSLTGIAGKAKKRIKSTLSEIRSFLNQWHGLYTEFETSGSGRKLTEAYRWTDEYIGITTEKFLSDLYHHVEQDEETESLLGRIRKLAGEVQDHGLQMGYISPDPESDEQEMEQRIQREGVLKKWAQSVLYLTHEESSRGRNLNQVIAGIAAAVAMSFAIVSTILAERYFPGRGLPWAVIIIVAYIFKDRIKESLRGILIRTWPSLVIDRRIRLTDRIGHLIVGIVSSRLRFGRFRDAPKAVRKKAARERAYFARLLPEDDLVYFRREFRIRSSRLRRYHGRLEYMTDIVRINLQDILIRMDDPEKVVPVFSEGKPVELRGSRTYPMTIVCRLSSGAEKTSLARRILLVRKGIRRIEPIES